MRQTNRGGLYSKDMIVNIGTVLYYVKAQLRHIIGNIATFVGRSNMKCFGRDRKTNNQINVFCNFAGT